MNKRSAWGGGPGVTVQDMTVGAVSGCGDAACVLGPSQRCPERGAVGHRIAIEGVRWVDVVPVPRGRVRVYHGRCGCGVRLISVAGCPYWHVDEYTVVEEP